MLAGVRMRGVILCVAVAASACGGAAAETGSSARSGTRGPSGTVGRPGASTARAAVPCGPRSARTLAASAVARVYVSHETVFGCSQHAHRQLTLGNTRTCIRTTMVTSAAVAGEIAAYGATECGVDTGRGNLVVRRLDTGRVLHTQPAVTGRVGVEGHTSVESVVVKPDGSAAWIAGAEAIGPPHSATEVHEVTATGSRLLDSGGVIASGSLRLRGARLSWRHGNVTRTATLR
jgi:hypothetical protein